MVRISAPQQDEQGRARKKCLTTVRYVKQAKRNDSGPCTIALQYCIYIMIQSSMIVSTNRQLQADTINATKNNFSYDSEVRLSAPIDVLSHFRCATGE
jgi:hypothetical protein